MRELVAQAGGRRAPSLWALTAALGLALLALGVASPAATAAWPSGEPSVSPAAIYPPDLPARVDLSRSPGATAAGPLSRAAVRAKLRRLAGKAGPRTGLWVTDLDAGSGRRVFAHKEQRRRILASNEKLFTTATALDRLGSGGRIATGAYRRGPIEGDTLKGDLYLVGGGDPALSGRGFAERNGLPRTSLTRLAGRVRASGVRRIEGKLRADDSAFDRRRGVPDSNWKVSPYIGGPLSALSYNAGRTRGGPALAAAAALRRELRKQGVEVPNGIGRGEAPRRVLRRDPLGEVRSPRLRTLVAATNKPSNNFYAEMLLKRIWAKPGRPGTTKGGAKVVRRFARRQGSGVHAVDGSGLTRSNRASAHEVGRLLAAMRKHEAAGAAFEASLAVAGRDGTLDDRMEGTRAAGRCRGKTGTLSGVSVLSGYCDAGAGVVAFSILMNGTDLTRARSLQDRMVVAIARYAG